MRPGVAGQINQPEQLSEAGSRFTAFAMTPEPLSAVGRSEVASYRNRPSQSHGRAGTSPIDEDFVYEKQHAKRTIFKIYPRVEPFPFFPQRKRNIGRLEEVRDLHLRLEALFIKFSSPSMNPKRRQCRRGAALVEFAIVSPILVGLFLGMCEVGSALNARIALQDAAAFGGRLASIGESSNAQVKQSVLTSLTVAGVSTANAIVTVSDLTHSGTDVHDATTLDKLQVSVSVPFKDVKWGVSGFIVHDSSLLMAKAVFYSARVNPYPTNISTPPGF